MGQQPAGLPNTVTGFAQRDSYCLHNGSLPHEPGKACRVLLAGLAAEVCTDVKCKDQHHCAAHLCGLAALLQQVPKAAHVGINATQHLRLLAKIALYCLLDFAVPARQMKRSSAAGVSKLAESVAKGRASRISSMAVRHQAVRNCRKSHEQSELHSLLSLAIPADRFTGCENRELIRVAWQA